MTAVKPMTQQAFLHHAKTTLGVTWDELALRSGIAARALKNYRLPDDSQNHRTMPALAVQAVERLLADTHTKRAKESA